VISKSTKLQPSLIDCIPGFEIVSSSIICIAQIVCPLSAAPDPCQWFR
jgi:hypothetical protein